MDTRLTIIDGLRDNDEHAWAEFDRLYRRICFCWVRSMGGNEALAADVYQNSVISLMSALDTYRHNGNPGAFRAFLKQIVKRRFLDHIRRESKHNGKEVDKPVNNGDVDISTPEPGDDSEMDRLWLHTILQQAMDTTRKRLSPQRWETFREYVIYDKPPGEVAETAGINEGLVYEHKNAFLSKLREEFIRLLDDVGDLGPALKDTTAARKYLKAILKDYVVHSRAFRGTMELADDALSVDAKQELDSVRNAVLQHPLPESAGPSVLVIETASPRWYPLQGATVIGSNSECDIHIDADGISGRHAQLISGAKGWRVLDLDSRNGLFVNRRKIGERELQNYDRIRIGTSLLLFSGVPLGAPVPSPATEAAPVNPDGSSGKPGAA